jgi:hypothetical protein
MKNCKQQRQPNLAADETRTNADNGKGNSNCL